MSFYISTNGIPGCYNNCLIQTPQIGLEICYIMSCPVCKSPSFGIISNIHKTPTSLKEKTLPNMRNDEFNLKVCRDCGVVYSDVSVEPPFKP